MKNEYGLTDKQETFAQAFIDCGYAPDAYRQAYDAENMQKYTISNEAYKLLKIPAIAQRIQNLRKQAAEQLQIDREFVAKGYIDIMKKAKEKGDNKNYLKASEQLVKLLGLAEGDKVNITGLEGFSVNIINPLKDSKLYPDNDDDLTK